MTDARAALAALAASGLSVRAFAIREGLDPQRLYRWRQALADGLRTPAPRPAPEVIEIRTRPADRVEIALPSGIVVRLPETIEPPALAELVIALELRRSAC